MGKGNRIQKFVSRVREHKMYNRKCNTLFGRGAYRESRGGASAVRRIRIESNCMRSKEKKKQFIDEWRSR